MTDHDDAPDLSTPEWREKFARASAAPTDDQLRKLWVQAMREDGINVAPAVDVIDALLAARALLRRARPFLGAFAPESDPKLLSEIDALIGG